MKERILKFIKAKGLNVSQFERKAGLSNSYLANTKGDFSARKMESILKAFPELNREWLLTGEGEMLNPVTNNTTTVNGGNAIGNGSGNVNHVNTNDVIEILHEQLRVKDEQIKGLIAALNK